MECIGDVLDSGPLMKLFRHEPGAAVEVWGGFEIRPVGACFGIYHSGEFRMGMFDTLEFARENVARILAEERHDRIHSAPFV